MLQEFGQYLATLGLAPLTVKNYVSRAKRLSMIDPATDGNALVAYVSAIEGSPSDHNQWMTVLKHWQAFLALHNVSIVLPPLKTLTARKRLPKPLSREEIDAICAAIPQDSQVGARDRALIELLYCGLRNNECCSIRFTDLNNQTVRIIGKGDKERLVPLNDVAWHYLVQFLLRSFPEQVTQIYQELGEEAVVRTLQKELGPEYVFTSSEGHPIYPRYLRGVVYKYAALAGVAHAHPHRFRHSFATHTLDEGLGNLIALKDVMGHVKSEMVDLYVLTSTRGRDMVKGFHPRQRTPIPTT